MGGFLKFMHVLSMIGGLHGCYVTHTRCTLSKWVAVILWNLGLI